MWLESSFNNHTESRYSLCQWKRAIRQNVLRCQNHTDTDTDILNQWLKTTYIRQWEFKQSCVKHWFGHANDALLRQSTALTKCPVLTRCPWLAIDPQSQFSLILSVSLSEWSYISKDKLAPWIHQPWCAQMYCDCMRHFVCLPDCLPCCAAWVELGAFYEPRAKERKNDLNCHDDQFSRWLIIKIIMMVW